MEKIIIVDGHNLLFRMFFGIPSQIKNSKGKEIKGLIGFIGSIKRLVREISPYSIIVVFDSETSKNNNKKIDIKYKEGRKDFSNVEEDNPFSQLELIKKSLDYLEVCNIEIQNDEADDYIASIVNNDKFKDYEFIIVSNDTDFIQLINDNTFLYVQRGKNIIIYDKFAIKEKYNILPNQYIEFKALIGDKCDNINGIKGIGPKTASKILRFGDIKKFQNSNISSDEKLKNTINNNIFNIKNNISLITLNSNLNIENITLNKISDKLINNKVREIISHIGEN